MIQIGNHITNQNHNNTMDSKRGEGLERASN